MVVEYSILLYAVCSVYCGEELRFIIKPSPACTKIFCCVT